MFTLINKEKCQSHFDFFFLKQYAVAEGNGQTADQLLEQFIRSRVFVDSFLPSQPLDQIGEFAIADFNAVASSTFHGPFVINHLQTRHFKRYKGSELQDLLMQVAGSGVTAAGDDFDRVIEQSVPLVEKYQLEKNALFMLNRDWFDPSDPVLAEFSSGIFDYYLLFLAIPPKADRLISLEYGAD